MANDNETKVETAKVIRKGCTAIQVGKRKVEVNAAGEANVPIPLAVDLVHNHGFAFASDELAQQYPKRKTIEEQQKDLLREEAIRTGRAGLH